MQKRESKEELQKRHYDALKRNRDKQHERKARTHRLIVRGAMVEKAIPNAESMSDAEFEETLFRAMEIAEYYMAKSDNWHGNLSQSETVGDSHGSDPR